MKLTIDEIDSVVTRDDGMMSFGVKLKGKVHTIEFAPETVEHLTMAVLAGSHDPLAPVSKRFRAAGVRGFQIDDDVGISFLLAPDIAIHLLLSRQVASKLQEFLPEFDDSSTPQIH